MIPGITEVNFPGYATLDNAVVTLAEMGDRTITTQLHVDGDQAPEYGVWQNGAFLPMELRFRGEPFILPIREPQASKDNSSRNSVSDLTFYSWAVYQMKRYYFFQTTTTATGVVVADKYKASVSLSIGAFCDLLNSVLEYYLGEDKIVVDLYEGTTSEPTFVEISYSYIWDVLQKLYDIYGVRWYIEYDSDDDIYYIRVGYPPKEIDDHDFEYGYDGGLIRFERQVQDGNVNNVLLGRGGTKNLPYRYFKKTDPQNPDWAPDPDAIPELANIYFDRLLDANFRWYIRGWVKNTSRDTSQDSGYTLPDYDEEDVPLEFLWAYRKGRYTDTVFNPVEFVRDAESIAKYGERWGALEDNDDIFPTIQGVMWGGSRIDTVLAVGPILTDDTEQAAETAAERVNVEGVMSQTDNIPANATVTRVIQGGTFVVPEDQTANLLDNGFFVSANVPRQQAMNIAKTDACRVLVYDSNGNEVSRHGIPEGIYSYSLRCVIQNNNRVAVDDVTYGVNGLYLQLADEVGEGWKPTFDIWVRNIFDTAPEDGESDEDYAYRVWQEILGDHFGNDATIVFSDGPMSMSEDYEFKIAAFPVVDRSVTYVDGTAVVTSEWRITLWKCDAEFEATGLYIPAASGAKPVAGNHIFFVGIDMPNMYVTEAEKALTRYKTSALSDLSEINPTWVVQLDKVRIDEEYNESQERLIDKLETGTKISVRDSRFTEGRALSLFLQSVTFTWANDTVILPSVDVVLTDKISPVMNPVAQLQSQIDVVKATYAQNGDIESIARAATRPMYLAKTGEEQVSQSPTKFASLLSSNNFRQGGFGGEGWGFYEDGTQMYDESDTAADDNPAADAEDQAEEQEAHEETAARSGLQSVLEVDRLIVRRDMMVNNLVVNQIAYIGGKQIISAAAIECVQVVEDTDGYRCYFDQKQGSVKNLFIVNDVAMGQVFSPEGLELRFYKRLVTEVGIDYIKLSKTNAYGTGVPKKGDVIVQYGNTQYEDRRYVIIRDVIGGGYEQMLSDLDNVNASGVEYYFAGMNSAAQGGTLPLRDVNGNQLRDSDEKDLHVLGGARPRFFVGTQESYIEFLEAEKTFYLHGTIVQSPAGVTFPVPCFREGYRDNEWYYYGDMVTYNGQSWIHIGKSRTMGTRPATGQIWMIYAEKGSSLYRLDLTNENASINANADGTIPAASVRPTCTATMYYGDASVAGAVYSLSTPQGQTVAGLSINSSSGVITFNDGTAATPFSFDGNTLEITVTAVKDSITQTAIMTVTKSRPGADGSSATSYWLVLDADKVGVNPNTDPETVSPTRVTPTAMLQVGAEAPRAAVAADNLSITYRYDDETEAALPAAGYIDIAIKNSSQARRHTLHFYLKKTVESVATIVDQESVPILYDGTDGKSSVRVDISNEMDAVTTNSAGAVQAARTVTTTVRVYDGATAASGISLVSTAAQLAIGGCTPTITTNTDNVVISWAFTTSHTIAAVTTKSIQVSYDGKTYSADFTVQPSLGQATYQLNPSLSAISFSRQSDGTLTPASRTLSMTVTKLDGTGTADQTISASGQTVRYSTSAMPASASGGTAWGTSDGTTGITWSSGDMVIANDVTVSNIYVAMFNGSGVIIDRETIPVIRDGSNGAAGDSGKSVRGPSNYSSAGYLGNANIPYQGREDSGAMFYDVVRYDGRTYYCVHGGAAAIASTPDVNSAWQVMQQYESIATKVAIIEDAQIENLTIRKVNTDPDLANNLNINGPKMTISDSDGPRVMAHADAMAEGIPATPWPDVSVAGQSTGISRTGATIDICTFNIVSPNNRVHIPEITAVLTASSGVVDSDVTMQAYLTKGNQSIALGMDYYGAAGVASHTAVIPEQYISVPSDSSNAWHLQIDLAYELEGTKTGTLTTTGNNLTVTYFSSSNANGQFSEMAGNGFRTIWSGEGFKATSSGAKVVHGGNEYMAVGGTAPSGETAISLIWKGTQAQYEALGTHYDYIMYVVKNSV